MLTAVLALAAGLVLGMAMSNGPAALAQSADKEDVQYVGAQRLALTQGMQNIGTKLDKLIDLLQSGKIKVVVVNAEGKTDDEKSR